MEKGSCDGYEAAVPTSRGSKEQSLQASKDVRIFGVVEAHLTRLIHEASSPVPLAANNARKRAIGR